MEVISIGLVPLPSAVQFRVLRPRVLDFGQAGRFDKALAYADEVRRGSLAWNHLEPMRGSHSLNRRRQSCVFRYGKQR